MGKFLLWAMALQGHCWWVHASREPPMVLASAGTGRFTAAGFELVAYAGRGYVYRVDDPQKWHAQASLLIQSPSYFKVYTVGTP